MLHIIIRHTQNIFKWPHIHSNKIYLLHVLIADFSEIHQTSPQIKVTHKKPAFKFTKSSSVIYWGRKLGEDR